MDEAFERQLEQIRAALIGDDLVIPGPFGPRRLLYADYTASGRGLAFIEDAVRTLALPAYANTHSETSFTGLQTTRLREGAREAIRRTAGADARHAVIFCGSGATAAIARLQRVMGLDRRAEGVRPVIFIGPYEHHSNDLIWRESAADTVRIPLDGRGHIDGEALEAALVAHADRPVKIGSFSAASNVTGVRTDLEAIAALLHRHGAWAFADYAAAGPYLPIRIGESSPGAADHLDAIFLSPHKFVGGPGASGVLVADRRLFANTVPSTPGGGTVAYVTAGMHRYVGDIERREEAGTPAILGDIRAGLALQLKADLGAGRIVARERLVVERMLAAFAAEPNLELLGPADADRLAIFSFNVRHGAHRLHPNFVVALLNDLFGIQARGGCSCAGPYGHDLLGISADTAYGYDERLKNGFSIWRPGWVRLNVNFFCDDATVAALVAAIRFVARRGADLLAHYTADPASGRWRAIGAAPVEAMGFDTLCRWRTDAPALPARTQAPSFAEALAEAERLADAARSMRVEPAEADHARWFALAGDAA